MSKEKQIIESSISGTGITINGAGLFDPLVHSENFTADKSRYAV